MYEDGADYGYAPLVCDAAVSTLRTLTLVDPAISAWKQPRVKAFGKEAGDDVVADWCDDETRTGSRPVVVAEGNARVTYVTLVALCTKSIWLVQLEISSCYGIKGDVAPLGLLLALRVLRARGCGLTGTCWRGGVRRLPGGRERSVAGCG